MLSDRSYMRNDDYPRKTTSVVVWLVSALLAAFVLELILLSPRLGSAAGLVNQLVLTVDGLKDWHVWTLLTHSFLHSTQNPFHILFTIVGLIFIGRELEPTLGSRRFLEVYAATILLGGLAWTAVNWSHGGQHIGAGAGVFGLLVVLAGVHPSMSMMVFFFPVSFQVKHIVYALLAVDLLALVFYEIPGAVAPLGLTPSAHLGGMLAGWVYFRYFHANHGWDRAAGIQLPAWLRRRKPGKSTAPFFRVNTGGVSTELRAEVDRILDKINSHGFGALTDEEKRVLDEAKDMLSRH